MIKPEMPPMVKPEVVFIDDLLRDIEGGELRVPGFQRPFVWKPSDMLALFDSIYKGYPIGSLLLWETSESVKSRDEIGPLSIPKPSSGTITYILDGHQRLATLCGSLLLPKSSPKGLDQKDWQWWIWFNLKEKIFTHTPKGDSESHQFPMRAVLKTMDFLEAAEEVRERFDKTKAKELKELKELMEVAGILAQRVKSYKVAITRIKGGSLAQAVEIFSLLNKTGQKIAPDQMVSALTYADQEEVTLAERIDQILSRLAEYHFGDLSRQLVFRAIILVATEQNMASTDWKNLAQTLKQRGNLGEASSRAETALVLAARFLHELGVPSDRLLPYSYQMLVLSAFFRECSTPTSRQREKLSRWFWVSSWSGWFAGASPITQINQAIEEMRNFANDPTLELTVVPLATPARPLPTDFNTRSARVRALLLFMRTLNPLAPATAQPVNPEIVIQNKTSYILPTLKRPYLSHPANRIWLERVPGQSIKTQLLNIPQNQLPLVLDSHGISGEAYEALQQDEGQIFIEQRAKHLAALEREFMKILGITLSPEEFGETDIDTDDE
jgi:hypothetical protein